MPGARRVRRRRRRRVAGRRAHDDLGALFDRLRDRDRHPAVLERPGGVRALDLQQYTRAPTCSESRGASSSGVLPSCSVTTGVSFGDRSRSRYASIMPAPVGGASTHSSPPTTRSTEPTRSTDVELADLVDRGAHVGLAREVRDEDQAGVVALPLLLHRLDRHVVVAEHAGDRGEHAGPVGDVERDVELRRRLVDRPDRLARERCRSSRRARPSAGSWRRRSRSPSTALAVGPPPAPRPRA